MIFNAGVTGGNNSEEIAAMLTQFISEVESTLTNFKSDLTGQMTALSSDMSTKIAAVTTNVNSKMTALTNLVNSTGGAVKSVQRGVHGGSATDNITITINTVNPSKCMVLLQRTRDTTNLPSLVSIASTSFTVTTSSAVYPTSPNTASPFSWQVIEFY